jgi:hypothetical protein
MSNSEGEPPDPEAPSWFAMLCSTPYTSSWDERVLNLSPSLVENGNVTEATAARDGDAHPGDDKPDGQPPADAPTPNLRRTTTTTTGWLPAAPGTPCHAPSALRDGPLAPSFLLQYKALSRVLDPLATAPSRGVPGAHPDVSSHGPKRVSHAEELTISVAGDDSTTFTGVDTGTDAVETAQSSSYKSSQAVDDDISTPAGAQATPASSQSSTRACEASSNQQDVPEVPHQDSASTSRLRDKDDASPCRQQWILRKEEDGQDNEALDALMLVDGCEDVKAHFLSVYDEARAARKRSDNVQLRTENLDVCFVEGSDFSE